MLANGDFSSSSSMPSRLVQSQGGPTFQLQGNVKDAVPNGSVPAMVPRSGNISKPKRNKRKRRDPSEEYDGDFEESPKCKAKKNTRTTISAKVTLSSRITPTNPSRL